MNSITAVTQLSSSREEEGNLVTFICDIFCTKLFFYRHLAKKQFSI